MKIKIKIYIKAILGALLCIDTIIYGMGCIPYTGHFWGDFTKYEKYLETNKALFAKITTYNIVIVITSLFLLASMVFIIVCKRINMSKKNFSANIFLIIQCILAIILARLTLRGVLL